MAPRGHLRGRAAHELATGTVIRTPFVWLFTWFLLLLSLALGVCGQFPPSAQPALCHQLRHLVIVVVRSVAKFLAG